jgi:hypothetical protein
MFKKLKIKYFCIMKNLQSHILAFGAILLICPLASYTQNNQIPAAEKARMHQEIPDQPYLAPRSDAKKSAPAPSLKTTGFFTAQVNVDTGGNNIVGDAANEPSIAIDPTDPNKMVIGWRQFDNVNSNFRQAGFGYTADGGLSWTFPGVITPGTFRSDPVLDFDTAGNFYYNSLTSSGSTYTCKVFKSTNGGAGWDAGVNAKGGDKQWMAIDRSGGVGTGNIYSSWTSYYSSCQPGFFTRSVNGGASFQNCIEIPDNPYWGTMTVGPDGELYVVGSSFSGVVVAKSTSAQNPGGTVAWDFTTQVDLDGYITGQDPINPAGILGQANIAVDRSDGPGRGNVYVMASVVRNSNSDPADVMFAKSTDGGVIWSDPIRINTDLGMTRYQWFGTMSVAPNGRIDIIWLDTRNAPVSNQYMSALYYCYSEDEGTTWSINKKLSESFDPHLGWPQQEKMGDYYDMESDNEGAHLAWANTLNLEQDVYYTHIVPTIVGMNENAENSGISVSGYPNPFRNQTTIRYNIPEECAVKVLICNLYGVEIRTLVDKNQPAGAYTINFSDELLPAGFYLCRLSAGTQTGTTRLIKFK